MYGERQGDADLSGVPDSGRSGRRPEYGIAHRNTVKKGLRGGDETEETQDGSR